MTSPTVTELCDAISSELIDFLSDMRQANREGTMFGPGGRAALKKMQNVGALLRAIKQQARDTIPAPPAEEERNGA